MGLAPEIISLQKPRVPFKENFWQNKFENFGQLTENFVGLTGTKIGRRFGQIFGVGVTFDLFFVDFFSEGLEGVTSRRWNRFGSRSYKEEINFFHQNLRLTENLRPTDFQSLLPPLNVRIGSVANP